MSEGEHVDRFCKGLKPQVRLEVMKSGAQTIYDAARIALNVDAALFSTKMLSYGAFMHLNAPTLMKIGNLQQKSKDKKNNACFKCRKVRCRPWKCGNNSNDPRIGNTSAEQSTGFFETESKN